MATLKELKERLNKIPDDILDKLCIGLNGDGGGEIAVVTQEEDVDWDAMIEKAPDLDSIMVFFENIQYLVEEDDGENVAEFTPLWTDDDDDEVEK